MAAGGGETVPEPGRRTEGVDSSFALALAPLALSPVSLSLPRSPGVVERGVSVGNQHSLRHVLFQPLRDQVPLLASLLVFRHPCSSAAFSPIISLSLVRPASFYLRAAHAACFQPGGCNAAAAGAQPSTPLACPARFSGPRFVCFFSGTLLLHSLQLGVGARSMRQIKFQVGQRARTSARNG